MCPQRGVRWPFPAKSESCHTSDHRPAGTWWALSRDHTQPQQRVRFNSHSKGIVHCLEPSPIPSQGHSQVPSTPGSAKGGPAPKPQLCTREPTCGPWAKQRGEAWDPCRPPAPQSQAWGSGLAAPGVVLTRQVPSPVSGLCVGRRPPTKARKSKSHWAQGNESSPQPHTAFSCLVPLSGPAPAEVRVSRGGGGRRGS